MEYEMFIKAIGEYIEIDLTKYKRPQMERRINSLMCSQGFSNYQEYLNNIKKDDSCLSKFLDHLTINVSEFYRNPSQWEIIKQLILPQIVEVNPSPRFWSAGCATGEEPYSLAMLIRESSAAIKPLILATDIDEQVLIKAVNGVYTERSVANVSPAILTEYFEKKEDKYHIKEEIKKMIKFRTHDLLKDTYHCNFDLILCRNVLIYFTGDTRKMLYKRFHDALRPGGILFTGSTEQIFKASQIGREAIASFFYKRVS